MLLGIEAHVCVLQTTLDLLDKGYEVHLLVDGISSQRAHDRAIGIQRMAQSGIIRLFSPNCPADP
jgi:nicotinamidase-related amidase